MKGVTQMPQEQTQEQPQEPEISNEIYLPCHWCAESMEVSPNSNNQRNVSGSLICDNCYEDFAVYCERCSGIFHIEDNEAVSHNEAVRHNVRNYCCSLCASNDGYHVCEDCGEACGEENVNSRGGYICLGCSGNYSRCEGCGDVFYIDDLNYNYDQGCSYCNNCEPDEDLEVSSRRIREDSRLIHAYSYKPEFNFQSMAWENTLFLGVELEVESKEGMSAENNARQLKYYLI
jgi:hypothetical protein